MATIAINTFPVHVDGQVVGALQISEPRDQERAFIRATRLRTGLTTLALAAVAAVVVMGLTFVLIGRPVRLLRAKTRRIASGDLTGALNLEQQDEIGDLARDIDQMCTDLASARQRAEDESRARVQALEQLRHADRLASVGTFASGIAHEMGTPLGVVLARARLIEEDTGLPRATASSAKIIAEQVERMSRIIRQLLEFARSGPKASSDGAPESPPQPVDVRALTRASAALLQPLAQKKQVRLVIDEGGPLLVRGQPGLLQQVLLNLLMNAMQAMDRSGEVKRQQRHHRGRAAGGGRGQRPDTTCACGSTTRGRAFRPRRWPGCSSRSSPPSRSAKAPVWACPSPGASCASSGAGSRCRARRARARASTCSCPDNSTKTGKASAMSGPDPAGRRRPGHDRGAGPGVAAEGLRGDDARVGRRGAAGCWRARTSTSSSPTCT